MAAADFAQVIGPTQRQKDQIEGHIVRGGRYAWCPSCGEAGGKHPVYVGDAVEFFCSYCERVVVAPALPSSNEDKAMWIETGVNFETSDPMAWGTVHRIWIEKHGCDHPSTRRVKHDVGQYSCGICGKQWNMNKAGAALLRKKAPLTSTLLDALTSKDKDKIATGLQVLKHRKPAPGMPVSPADAFLNKAAAAMKGDRGKG